MKLFDHKFFFKHIATQCCDFSQWCFSLGFVFWLVALINFIGWQHSQIIFYTLELILFSTPKGEKISITRKRNYCILSRCVCAKLKIFLSEKKFLKWTPTLLLKKEKSSIRMNKFAWEKHAFTVNSTSAIADLKLNHWSEHDTRCLKIYSQIAHLKKRRTEKKTFSDLPKCWRKNLLGKKFNHFNIKSWNTRVHRI